MATISAFTFENQATTGLTATAGPGSFSYPINYQPSLGSPDPTYCLKIHGGQSGWNQTGVTLALPATPSGYMIFWQFSIDGGEARISLEPSNKLWTADTDIVSIHYTQATPLADLYSGVNDLYPDALNSDEFLDHFFEVTPTGAILGRHRHYTTPGTINPFSGSVKWSTGSWGLTNIADHMNYATAVGAYWSLSFKGTSGQACYLDELYVTTNGLIQRAPLNLIATATGDASIDLAWDDNDNT